MATGQYQHLQILDTENGGRMVAFNVANRPVNVFTQEVMEELDRQITEIESNPKLKAVIFLSAKESGFFAGADVKLIEGVQSPEVAMEMSAAGQRIFSRIEGLRIPTVAVIHGPCLGGGLEFALACRYRIASDDAKTRLGLPEVELGILPAWGGTQRLPRLIGVIPAVQMILQTRKQSAAAALKLGLVDAIAGPNELSTLVDRFAMNVLTGRGESQRAKMPIFARLMNNTRIGRWMIFRGTRQRIAGESRNYPALEEALGAIESGMQQGVEAGYVAEREALGRLLFTPACRSLLSLFFGRERARAVSTWLPAGGSATPAAVKSIAVIGGGIMGAGIAQLAAQSGIPVVVKEANEQFAQSASERIRHSMQELVKRGSVSAPEAERLSSQIVVTTAIDRLRDVSLVIEAVPEKEQLKRDILAEMENVCRDAVLSSNTSAIPIRKLATALRAPQRFAGLHFFNPVHRMQLVEIVRTAQTDDATAATLVDVVRKLGKTPVVVKDYPGFLVNRILMPYLDEAVRLYLDGVDARAIDRDVKRFGMPMGPLELLDQIGLDVAAHVAGSMGEVGREKSPTPGLLAEMSKAGHLGKKSGEGFYRYKDDKIEGPVREGEGEGVAVKGLEKTGLPEQLTAIQQRVVLALVNEAEWCAHEEVAKERWMIDLAMVLGTGFAPFRGGPCRMVDGWGRGNVREALEELERSCGARYTPSPSLRG